MMIDDVLCFFCLEKSRQSFKILFNCMQMQKLSNKQQPNKSYIGTQIFWKTNSKTYLNQLMSLPFSQLIKHK